jgi:2-aminoadipate transaminase
MDYRDLFSRNPPPETAGHPGLAADTEYVFSVTYTDPDTMPTDGLVDSLRTAMAREGRDLSRYPPPQGHEGMRELIADALRTNRGVDVPIERIFLSGGAAGAIDTILDAFLDPGDTVLCEEFSYSGTLNMLARRRANVVHVPTDWNGMDTEALEGIIQDLAARGVRPKMIYTVSVYQNPMGMTLSADRRRHMVEISQKYGIPIFENESYADFRIDGDPLPPAMMAMDDQDSVMYVSAYTKLLGCGLRLGFGVVPEPVLGSIKARNFGASPSHLAAMAVYQYLRDNGDRYIPLVASSLGAKRDAMLAALGEHFPPGIEWSAPTGGMMLWGRLPEGADTWAALDHAIEAGVKFNPGPIYRADRTGHNYMRLTYSYHNPDQIRQGIAILGDVFERQGLFNEA